MYNINTVTLTNNMWHWPLSLMRWPSKRSLQIECYALLWPICSVCQMVTLYSSQSVSMCIQSGLLRDPFIIVSKQPPHKEDIEWAVKTRSRFFMLNKVHVENLNVILTKSTKTGKLLFPAWDFAIFTKENDSGTIDYSWWNDTGTICLSVELYIQCESPVTFGSSSLEASTVLTFPLVAMTWFLISLMPSDLSSHSPSIPCFPISTEWCPPQSQILFYLPIPFFDLYLKLGTTSPPVWACRKPNMLVFSQYLLYP